MKVLHQYIIRQTLITLAVTVAVFTFVFLLGGILQRLSEMLVNRQVGLQVVGLFALLILPYLLSFALPMSLLAAVLLVFGRLSADNEITAMRASGVSLGQVAAPVVVLSFLMAAVCFYLNARLAPECRFLFRTAFVRLGTERPMALIEEGVYMRDFPGYVLYVGRKKGNVIEDVSLYSLDDKGQTTSSIRARRGIVTARPENRTLLLDLYDVRGDLRDPDDPTNVRKIRAGTTAQRYPIELDLGKVLRQARSARRVGDYTLAELFDENQRLRAQGIYPAIVVLEAHQRVASAIACVAFTLVGIPLGLRTSRRETSIGIALSLGLAFLYYLLIMVANTVKDRPQLYPEAILWAPNLLFQLAGLWLLWRASRR